MPQVLDNARFPQNCVARALFDNIAEAPDELSFKKGDILTVLEQNTAGLEGWWLCCLRGRQGICPGNRLRLLAGVYDSGRILNDELSLSQGQCRRWHKPSNKVITPQKVGDVYLYDFPANKVIDPRYDVPPSGQPMPIFDHSMLREFQASQCNSRPESSGSSGGYSISEEAHDIHFQLLEDCFENNRYDTPKWPSARTHDDSESYDVPRPIHACDHISLCSSDSSFARSVNGSRCSSNRSSFAPDYDVPRPRPVSPDKLQQNKFTVSAYDVPMAGRRHRELPLELNSAIENLERLESEMTTTINTLLSYAGPSWRERDKLQPKMMDIKLTVLRLRSALHDLSEFSDGVLGNAMNAPDKGLVQKLRPLTKALHDTNDVVQESAKVLVDCDWSVDAFVRNPNPNSNEINYSFDSLDQLIVCARCLTEDVREFASFVQGNATLLFKRNPTDSENSKDKLFKESDYINLETHKSLKKQHSEVRNLLSRDMQKSFDLLIKESENGNMLNEKKYDSKSLDYSDRKVLSFYAAQCATHSLYLTHAIDAFLNTVEHNQPPMIFLAHGKFVVLSAHRLVHIGDTVNYNVTCPEISGKVLQLSNALSEGLAATVYKIKRAAMQFPSVSAVQEMVDSVVDVSHLARDLKMYIVISSQT